MGIILQKVASEQALLDAWTEVRQSAGQIDGIPRAIREFEANAAREISIISSTLLDGTWRPLPVRQVRIKKESGGNRELGISAVRDRIVERAMLKAIDPLVDAELLPTSFAYRRGLGVADAINAVQEVINDGCSSALRGDIRDCFGNIPREATLQRLSETIQDAEAIGVVRLLLFRGVSQLLDVAPLGLYQGSALSPLLANLYLDLVDRALLERGFKTIRYADDFVIPLDGSDSATTVISVIETEFVRFGLSLAPEKMCLETPESGIRFLGQTVQFSASEISEALENPSSSTLYVTQPGALIRSKGKRLSVERHEQRPLSIPYSRVRQIVIFGRVGLTTPLLQQLMIRNIDLVLLSDHGQYFGRLEGALASNPFIRDAQYANARDRAKSLEIAKQIVVTKIANQRTLLAKSFQRTRILELTNTLERLRRAGRSTSNASSMDVLLGHEGSAARAYFAAYGLLVGEVWSFQGRKRRPPPDPVNSMLSFGYSILLQEVMSAIYSAGLDPYAGYLHRPRIGQPSLALDLMEEFRPIIVDSLVLRLINLGQISVDDFSITEGPPKSCLLQTKARKIFLAALEKRLLTLFLHPGLGRKMSYRAAIGFQAKVFARELNHDTAGYVSVRWK